MGKEDILVSIIVLSYNSESTIIETLESIYNQTYKKIELIIADDCSSDATKQITKEWIDKYATRFIDVKENFKKKNEGVSINADDGIKLSTGEWIKCIAADDKLIEDSIEKYVEYINKNDASIVFSNMHHMRNEDIVKKNDELLRCKLKKFTMLSEKEQYKKLLIENPLPAPTAFFSRKLYDEVGGFDREINMIEDWPFWINVTKRGIQIKYIDIYTVEYRMSESSVSHSSVFWKEAKKVKEKYCYPNISKKKILYFYHEKWHNMMWKYKNRVKENRVKGIAGSLFFGIFWPPYLLKYIQSSILYILRSIRR